MFDRGCMPFNGGVPGGWFVAMMLLLASPALAENDSSLERDVEDYLERTESPPVPRTLRGTWRLGPVLETVDDVFKIRLRSRMLIDTSWSDSRDFDSPVTDDGFFLRQARLGAVGTGFGRVPFMVELDFAKNEPRVFDVFVGLKDVPMLGTILVGHQREPIGLDAMTPLPFLALLERAPSTRALGRGRNVGVRIQNVTEDRRLTYWAGLFRETNRFAQPRGEGGYAFTGKITGIPVAAREGNLLHLELGFSVRDPADGEARFNARHGPANGVRLVDTGAFPASRELEVAAAAALRLSSFVIQVEGYVVHASGSGTNATFWGGYVLASYWLTGEVAPYARSHAMWVRAEPLRNFHDGERGVGAWLLAARFDHVDLTDGAIQGGVMDTVTVGVTWLWNPNARVKFEVVHADVEGGPYGTGTIVTAALRFQWDF